MRRLVLAFVSMCLLAPAAAARPDDVETVAAMIDRHLAARWQQAGVRPAERAGDGEFLRRVSLELIGRIPTGAEARTFLDDPAPDKRHRVVEKLLESPGHEEHFARLWRALLLPEREEITRRDPGFERWLRRQFGLNIPYDRFVRELLTHGDSPLWGRAGVAGSVFSNDATPEEFYLAKEMKPENLAAATARLFLGVRLECAQCHDHPLGHWSRRQFWSFAAFFAGLTRAPDRFVPWVMDRIESHRLEIPGSGLVVDAAFLDGGSPEWRANVSPRVKLAAWVTAPDNPFFARATVNRVWAMFFGIGLVEPVDDFTDDHPPSHPELLDDLARVFVRSGYDLNFLIRVITASAAYQLSSAGRPGEPAPDPRLFARMTVKAMTPDQLFDSLVTATGFRPSPGRYPDRRRTGDRFEFVARFAAPGQSLTEVRLSVAQALAMMNGQLIAEQTNFVQGRALRSLLLNPRPSTAGTIEEMYLMTLSRRPTAEELARLVRYVEDPRRKSVGALEDVFWVLLNSPEFLLNH